MLDDHPLRAHRYREIARELRHTAFMQMPFDLCRRDQLLALAKEHDRAARATAARAVELFDAYVRAPIREESQSDAEAAERLVEAFRTLLPATTRLVAHHFQRVLLATAQARFEGPATAEEVP